jgi:hypothetical protein
MTNFNKKVAYAKVLLGAIVLSVVFFTSTFAATLSLSSAASTVSVGNIVSVKVLTNTLGKAINNAEATIQFPTDLLEVVSVSKNSSIFTLWVEEPRFSNSAGTIVFNGGVANPGFTGTSGSIASIVFKAKKPGAASLVFADAAVRENDGLGTDILTAKNSTVIQITTPAVVETPPVVSDKGAVPVKPIILSSTHPDSELWYKGDSASFSWKIPSGITSVQASLSTVAHSIPTITYDNSVTEKTLKNLSDGTYYFHLRYANSYGWSPVAERTVNVDSTAPEVFVPTIRSADNQNIITLNAKDATSGIEYYTLGIDGLPVIRVKKSDLIKNEYTLPVLNQGEHTLIVTAYDKADNFTEANLMFTSSFISTPTIALSASDIHKNDSVVISGTSEYPGKHVLISLESNGESIKTYTQTIASDGTYSVTTDKIKTLGLISFSAVNVMSDTVQSASSEKVYLTVTQAPVIKVVIAIVWIFVSMLVLLILLILVYIGWHKFFGLKRKTKHELQVLLEDTHRATLLLKDELHNQLDILEKVRVDRNLNKNEEAIFTELQKNVDDVDTFIEKKLKKLME